MSSSTHESVAMAGNADVVASIKATMEKASRIATLPAVAVRIIQICNAPDSAMENLIQVIDPVLAAKILRLVNSAFYGVSGQIKSIKHAILMLGLNAVKNIAIAASLVKMGRGVRLSTNFHATDLWEHSVAVGAAARLLAEKTNGIAPDEAFLAGLLHDIGIIVELQTCRAEFIQLLDQLAADEQLTFRRAEELTLGANHEVLGAELCAAWNFPRSLQFAVGYHHHPWDLPEPLRELPLLVHVADVLAARNGIGYTRTVETDVIDPMSLESLRLTDSDLEQIVERLPEAMHESSSLLSDDH